MSIAVAEHQRAIAGAVRRWAAARAGEAVPADDAAAGAGDWDSLTALGLPALAAGTADGDIVDLAVAIEETAIALSPGPITPTALAGLLLRGHPAAARIADGRIRVAVVLDDHGILRADDATDADTAKDTADDTGDASGDTDGTGVGLRVSGACGPVLSAGETTHLLLPARTADGTVWVLVASDHVRLTAREPLDPTRTLGDLTLDGVPAEQIPGLTLDRVRTAAAVLFAAEASGVARWCVQTAAAYAATRTQFGRPIGSFQAVKHLCAAMLCRAERAAAVAWDAARALDEADEPAGDAGFAPAIAAAIALDAAADNAKDCIQVLGGIGFTWEHPAHRYLRRAIAVRQLLGDTSRWRVQVAGLAVAGARRALTVPVDAVAAPVRQTVERIAALPPAQQRAALADAGLLTPQWPAPYGLGASALGELAVHRELARAGVPRPDLAIGGWAAPTILRHGTDEQRKRFVGPSLRGEITWCQLFSEPEAGSDLASLRTRAERTTGGWTLTGQKVWTSLAREADWAICLARTDSGVPKHKGITYFLVAMDSPGVDVRPLREITGRAVFNEVFLDGVFVPDDCVVGEPGDGWRLARTTLSGERIAMGLSSTLDEHVELLVGAAQTADEQLGAIVAENHAVDLLDLRATLRLLDPHAQAADDSALRKLVGVAHRQAVAEARLRRCGPQAAAADRDAADPAYQFLLTRCLSIAGGTTQILLTLVGERLLGLPREPDPGRSGAMPGEPGRGAAATDGTA